MLASMVDCATLTKAESFAIAQEQATLERTAISVIAYLNFFSNYVKTRWTKWNAIFI